MEWQETRKMAEKLEDYAELFNDEFGEALSLLSQLHWRSEYLGEEIQQYLAGLILDKFQYCEENYEIVENERIVNYTEIYCSLVEKLD